MTLTIGHVERLSGVSASAIRFYEKERVLPVPTRKNGRRFYDRGIFRRLAIIELAKEAGFTISEIRQLTNGFLEETSASVRWRTLASTKIQEIDLRITRAKQMRKVLEAIMQCECSTLNDCAGLVCEADGAPIN